MKRVRELENWYKVPEGEAIVYNGILERTVELRVMAVGPLILRVAPLDDKGKVTTERFFLGYVESGEETFQWTRAGDFAVILEPTVEVHVWRDQSPVAKPLQDRGPSFTRFEKAGLYVDPLGIALHRQAVLERLSQRQQRQDGSDYTRSLEERLAKLAEQIEALTPPPPQVEPVSETAAT